MHILSSVFSSPSRISGRFLLPALIALFSLTFSACESGSVVTEATTSATPAKSTNATAPPAAKVKIEQVSDFDIQMMDGSKTKLSSLQGERKVLVLDFWATWCGPCKQEIPHLVELQNQYKEKGVEVVGLTVEDPEDEIQKVKAFAKAMNINYRVGFSSDKMFNTFNGNDPRGAIPQTFVFDRNGNLVKHISGFSPAIANTLRESIEQALKQS